MTVGRRHQLPLPANGFDLAEIIAKELQLELQKYFRAHLAYPNASMKIQWASTFYCMPKHYEGELLVQVSTEGITETQLVEQGVKAEMEMGQIEIGVQSAISPATINRGVPFSSPLPPSPTESKGRRDLNARRGKGIEFMAGQPVNENLANVGDQSRIQQEANRVLSDLPKSENEEPLHENTIIPVNELAK